jgi:CheY-like chemotaxis protein
MDSLRNKKILIAEDDSDTREMMSVYLGMYGLETTAVENGEQALESVDKLNPDLVITDLDMPKKDGLTFLLEIREKEAAKGTLNQLPVIVISGGGENKLSKAKQAGASVFLKPISCFDDLINKIKELLVESMPSQLQTV